MNRKRNVSSTFEYFLALFCDVWAFIYDTRLQKTWQKICKTGPKGGWAQMTPNRSDFGSTFVQKLMKFFLYFQWSSNFYNSQETCLKCPGIFSCTFLTRLDFHLRHSTQECRQKLRKTGLKGGWSQMRQFYSIWVTCLRL